MSAFLYPERSEGSLLQRGFEVNKYADSSRFQELIGIPRCARNDNFRSRKYNLSLPPLQLHAQHIEKCGLPPANQLYLVLRLVTYDAVAISHRHANLAIYG